MLMDVLPAREDAEKLMRLHACVRCPCNMFL